MGVEGMKAALRVLVSAVSLVFTIGPAHPGVPRKEQVVGTILQAAQDVGVDALYMLALADKESALNPRAKARTSSAEGLFQFVDQTWLEVIWRFGGRHDLDYLSTAILKKDDGAFEVPDSRVKEAILKLRLEPYVSAVMAAELLKHDTATLEEKFGRELQTREFYLTHFLGRQGAGRLLEVVSDSPRTRASRLFPAAAEANRPIFYDKPKVATVVKTVVRKRRKKLILKKVKVRIVIPQHRSAGEVYLKLGDMILKRMARFAGRLPGS
jgi:Transglycosylase SLT domain